MFKGDTLVTSLENWFFQCEIKMQASEMSQYVESYIFVPMKCAIKCAFACRSCQTTVKSVFHVEWQNTCHFLCPL